MALKVKRIHCPTTAFLDVSSAEYKELSKIWKRIEKKWKVEIEDVSVEMSMCAQIVKEVTFKGKGKRGLKPMQIRLDWDQVMFAEDGAELSEFETEKNVIEQVDSMLEFYASEEAI